MNSFAALAVTPGARLSRLAQIQRRKGGGGLIGAFSYLAPVPLFAVVLLFILLVAWTRYLSLGSVVAAGLFPSHVGMILYRIGRSCGSHWSCHSRHLAACRTIFKEFGPENSGSSASGVR